MAGTVVRTLQYVVGSTGAIIACSVLGAFGGCTLGGVEILHERNVDQGIFIICGLAVGAITGILVAVALTPAEGPLATVRPAYLPTLLFAIACIGVSLLSLGILGRVVHPEIALDMPLHLDRSGTTTGTFKSNDSGLLRLVLALKRPKSENSLDAFVPASSEGSGERKPEPSAILLSVSVDGAPWTLCNQG